MESQIKKISHIIDLKRKEIVKKSLNISTRELEESVLNRTPYRSFHSTIADCVSRHEMCVIGDVLRTAYCCKEPKDNFNPAKQAKQFVESGVHAISVATDENFYNGNDEDLKLVNNVVKVPVLRKEFIIDGYQVLETACLGADCIILKAYCLPHLELLELSKLAKDVGLDVIVEVQSLSDLDKLIDLPVRMVSISNFDIETEKVDLSTSMNLAGQLPKDYLVFSDYGIENEGDVEILLAGGVHGFFINACQENESPESIMARLFHGQSH